MKKHIFVKNAFIGFTLIVLLGIFASLITASMWQTPFIVQDLETGRTYPVLVGNVYETTPGLCDDGDNGFKLYQIASIAIENPHGHTVQQFTDTIDGNVINEYACGDQIALDGIIYRRLAFRLAYQDTSS